MDKQNDIIEKSKLYFEVPSEKLPIIYRDEYNIKFLGFEKLHPFDSGKWGNVISHLKKDNFINDEFYIKPNKATHLDLSFVHTSQYINSLEGNGYERDFINYKDIYILDVYNKHIYPRDTEAKKAINRMVELSPFTADDEYLHAVKVHVEGALNEFEPHFVVYNAGTDILAGDSLGLMSVTAEGIIKRDEIVWKKVRDRGIPIAMLTSGGYKKCTAKIIADSILNLRMQGIISFGT